MVPHGSGWEMCRLWISGKALEEAMKYLIIFAFLGLQVGPANAQSVVIKNDSESEFIVMIANRDGDRGKASTVTNGSIARGASIRFQIPPHWCVNGNKEVRATFSTSTPNRSRVARVYPDVPVNCGGGTVSLSDNFVEVKLPG
jgi:hypothetical protein